MPGIWDHFRIKVQSSVSVAGVQSRKNLGIALNTNPVAAFQVQFSACRSPDPCSDLTHLSRVRYASSQASERIVEPTKRAPKTYARIHHTEVAHVDEPGKHPAKSDIAGSQVFGILANIPPIQRFSRSRHLRRLADVIRN